MIDPALIRKEPDRVRSGLKARGGKYLPAFEEYLKLDEEHRALLKEVEDLRAKRNASSQLIGKAKAAKDETEAQRLMKEVAGLKTEMAGKEESLTASTAKTRRMGLSFPNLPHETCPAGKSEKDNPLVRESGKPRELGFKPLDHQALGEKLGILDGAMGAKLAGSRFYLWRGAGARLMRAITQFELDLHTREHGYIEISPPYLVRPEILEGTGQLPNFEDDLYRTRSSEAEKSTDLYLIPTAEVPLTNLVRVEILAEASLPMKFTAYTPCFRQEAGSYGKDVRGVIRNHQFDKVELVWVTKPEESLKALEELTTHAEAVLRILEIPYRIIELCTADLGTASRKTYDLEVWMPSSQSFREISSCSDCGDYQARRMNARMRRGAKGSPEFVHTLNGSGVAVGRLFAALLENFQQEDGTIKLPKALVSYFGSETITGPA